jgi:transglutaminase-like putative cysteine protease/tetratricopeptide (TPR) repeat protein
VVVALFWSQGRFNVSIFEHPSILAATVTLFLLTEVVLTMIASVRIGGRASAGGAGAFATAAGGWAAGGAARLRRRELLPLLVVVLPLLLAALMLLLGRYSEASTAQGGGLIRPTLFRFDFADYINLESEISLSRDLVLLYRESAESAQQQLTMRSGGRLLRRFVLSGYDPRQGFFAEAAPGEEGAPRTVGEGSFRLPGRGYERRSDLRQEYYLVNFDPSSLVSVNYPVQVAPFEAWSNSSFARIYEVRSRASDATPETLRDAATPAPAGAAARWASDRHSYYTDYGGNEAIAELAREVTAGVSGDYAQARAIERYFHEEFFYSLRPGVAADGDQLSHFLFESQKGYCSYFAFSMTLMARSLGLPARVAVGFFVDPRMSVMDYYAVRADMAHAWVEIYFEDYGWIEFDPTASTVAPGEEFSTDPNLDMEQISALLEELMEHRNELRPSEPSEADSAGQDGGGGLSAAAVYRFMLRYWAALLAGAYLLSVAAYRLVPRLRAAGARDFRGRVQMRFGALLRELDAVGLRARPGETIAEYAERVAARHGLELPSCASFYLQALFGDAFEERDYHRYLEEEAELRRGLRRRLPWWRHLLGFLAPYLHLRAPSPAVRVGSVVATLLVLQAVNPFPAALLAQQTRPEEAERSAQWYADRAIEAIDGENYERAVQMLTDGQERHPESVQLYTILGDLYFDEELYRLALSEYQEAEQIEPENFAALHSAALSLGRLNRERDSVHYLERLLQLYPDSPDVIADLGWMYFKTHQLQKGEELLLEAIEDYGSERSLTMTLGTIYADMYRFEDSKEYYERSIESALEDGRSYFASVAYYNLSLLQKAFFRFNGAMQSTERSLAQATRSTGHLAKGELYEMQMDFRRAHDEYTEAYNLDEDTPLAKLDLAALYQTFGRLDEALAYARDVYDSDDLHWLFNFGTDEQRHRMELHHLLSEIYRAKATVRSYEPAAGPIEWVSNLAGRIRYRVLAWYHDMTFRRFASGVAEAYEQEGSILNAHWTYYRAQERYPRLALRALEEARGLETEVIPEAEPFYLMRVAMLRDDRAAIAEAVNAMHPRWERSSIAEGLREIAIRAHRDGDVEEAQRSAVELYRLNRGGLRQHGIELPLQLSVTGADGRVARRLVGSLRAAGLRPTAEAAAGGEGASSPLRLEVRVLDAERVSYRFLDADRFVLGDSVGVPALDRDGTARIAREITDAIFRVE